MRCTKLKPYNIKKTFAHVSRWQKQTQHNYFLGHWSNTRYFLGQWPNITFSCFEFLTTRFISSNCLMPVHNAFLTIISHYCIFNKWHIKRCILDQPIGRLRPIGYCTRPKSESLGTQLFEGTDLALPKSVHMGKNICQGVCTGEEFISVRVTSTSQFAEWAKLMLWQRVVLRGFFATSTQAWVRWGGRGWTQLMCAKLFRISGHNTALEFSEILHTF